jgi:hypothetical protein
VQRRLRVQQQHQPSLHQATPIQEYSSLRLTPLPLQKAVRSL